MKLSDQNISEVILREILFDDFKSTVYSEPTLPIAEILSGKNARAWVSMVLYLKK